MVVIGELRARLPVGAAVTRPTNTAPCRPGKAKPPPGKTNREAKMIHVENVSKTFLLHQQNGVRLPVLQNASLEVSNGECVVLH
ncbi:hypothetical protein ACVGWS_13475, partial [Enterobacter hormaechei]